MHTSFRFHEFDQRCDAVGQKRLAGSGRDVTVPNHSRRLYLAHRVHGTCCRAANLDESRFSESHGDRRHCGDVHECESHCLQRET